MEYFIGSISTIFLIIVLLFFVRKMPKEKIYTPIISQSRIFHLAGFHFADQVHQEKTSQSLIHHRSTMLRIFIMDDIAYWIEDNKVLTTNIIDGEINSDDGVEVDMMSMSDVQLKEMLFIIDQLKDNDENRNSGQ